MLGAAQDDFGSAIVVLDCSFDFYLTAFQLSDVSHLFFICGEDYYREGAFLVRAKIQDFCSVAAGF